MSTPIADAQKHHTHDVGAERIARVYAEALYAATPKNESEAIGAELAEFLQAFQKEPALASFFSSGIISANKKANFIEKNLRGKASETLVNFLHVVNNHMRLGLLVPILNAYREILDEKKQRVRVQVKSAVPLNDQQRERLKSDVRAAFKFDPILLEQIDPELLGGLVVRVGDWQFDGTVRARLNQLKNQLLERSSHEIQGRRDRFSTL